jgi:hypothetical protein
VRAGSRVEVRLAPCLCARHSIVPLSHPARLISARWVLPIAGPALAEAAVVVVDLRCGLDLNRVLQPCRS